MSMIDSIPRNAVDLFFVYCGTIFVHKYTQQLFSIIYASFVYSATISPIFRNFLIFLLFLTIMILFLSSKISPNEVIPMSVTLQTNPREQAGAETYNRYEYQVHWIVCQIISRLNQNA